jgi:hypothetical protein
MTEDEARTIAQDYVINKSLDRCFVASVRKFSRADVRSPWTIGDEWVIQFQFENDGSYAAEYTSVMVDDATGEARLMEHL